MKAKKDLTYKLGIGDLYIFMENEVMKTALFGLIAGLFTVTAVGQRHGLSKKAQEEFKIGAYIAYKEH